MECARYRRASINGSALGIGEQVKWECARYRRASINGSALGVGEQVHFIG